MSENKYRETPAGGIPAPDYPRPSVAVDTAVLALDPEQGLVVLEVRRPTGMGWALPGTFIHEGETLAEAVDRSLRVKANVRGLHPRQLHVFDDPTRDDRGWVLSVAHVQVVRQEQFGGPLRRHNEARVNRRAWAAAIQITPTSSSLQSRTFVRTISTSRIRTDFSATSSRFGNYELLTRRSPDSRCNATPSDVRWNRTLSPLVPAASAEGAALPSFSADPSDQ